MPDRGQVAAWMSSPAGPEPNLVVVPRGALCLLLLLLPAPLAGQCDTVAGEAAAGERWEAPFGQGLLFRLEPAAHAPPNPPGWTIQVRSASDGEHDFVPMATPPYRSSNPRDLNTGYGTDARKVVEWDVRGFRFAVSERQNDELSETVRFLLWKPVDMTQPEYDAAYDSVRAVWESLIEETGRGRLRITDAQVRAPGPDLPNGRIERLAFRATLCPSSRELPPLREPTSEP